MIISPSHRIAQVEEYYFATKLAEIAEMNKAGAPVINLGIGSPDLPVHPNVTNILASESLKDGASMYQSYRGVPALREALANHYQSRFQADINPHSEILPLIGSKEGIMHIAMSFLNPGDKVLVPNPGYPAYRATAKIAGAEVIDYKLSEVTGWLPDLASLEKTDLSDVKIMWINYPHMPTGANATLAVFEELVAFARRYKILICHDNPYNYILNPTPLSIFQIAGAKDCALELFSFSKGYNMAGWRIGALVGAPDNLNAVMRFKSNMDSGMYKPAQLAAVEALKLDHKWFDALNTVYQDRRTIVWELFDLLGCNYDKYATGMFVWAKVPDHIADVESYVDEILQQARVFITPGFIFGSQGERYLRISLCTESNMIKQAIKLIERQFIKAIA
jgi:aspartate/methionine/tyrosine aminotransferase